MSKLAARHARVMPASTPFLPLGGKLLVQRNELGEAKSDLD
jgi:hypothetical protein